MSSNTTALLLPCGSLYNLTVSSNTTVMDGWYCGEAASSGAWPNTGSYNGTALNFNKIECNNGSFLDITETTTVLEGYLCSLLPNYTATCTSSQNFASSNNAPNWKLLLFVCIFILPFFNI